MQVSERGEFTEIFARLCQVFDKVVTPELADAYWTACAYMNVRSFRIACERAIEQDERMPRPSQLWRHYRSAKSGGDGRTASITSNVDAPKTTDPALTFRNRAFLNYAMREGPFKAEELPKMQAEGERIVRNFEIIAKEETVTGEEIRAALYREWGRIRGQSGERA